MPSRRAGWARRRPWPPPRRRRRKHRHRQHHRVRSGAARSTPSRWIGSQRWLATAGILVGLGGVVLAVWAAVDLWQVRSQLTAARHTLDQASGDPRLFLTSESRKAVADDIDSALATIGSARRRVVGSPALSLAKFVPGVRGQRSALVSLIDDSTAAASVGRTLLAKVEAIAARAPLADGRVPIEAIRELAGDVAEAAGAVQRLAGPAPTPWGPVGDARRRFLQVVRSGAARLRQGSDDVRAALGFMGAGGPRRYLVAMQNNAEMRDQGAVLSYIVIRFDDGRLSFERSGSISELRLAQPTPTPIQPGTTEVFGSINPSWVWQSVNATADFAWSGRAMVDMYHQATGESLDGVIAVDVPGLASLLRGLGPVSVPGIAQPITDKNVATVLLHDLYQGVPPSGDQSAHHVLQAQVTRAVVERLTSGAHDAVALGRQLGRAASRGHLRLWSRDGGEQQVFEQGGLGGSPAAVAPDRTFHLAVENRTATKLDYFVKARVAQEVTLTGSGTAVVRTTIVLDNQAPVNAVPSYQLGPDGSGPASRPGDYLAWLLLWSPSGSTQLAATPESGLMLSQRIAKVGAGEQRTLVFETVVPNAVRDGRLVLRLVPQPRLEPVDLEVRLKAPGWHVEDALLWRGKWEATRTFSWRVSR